ncbi:MAG: DNA-deoxyinosine glycosylase [Clostridia bacterium]|nr:DNA-deoxyinosine glycosylase [Clostridia bacterium]
MRVKGFPPFLTEGDILVVGSFPSVKSRETSFYYGNRQNRFWRVLAEAFSCPCPDTLAEKQALLVLSKVSLWDVVTECNIVGSMDKDIKDPVLADLPALLSEHPFKKILANGATAYTLLMNAYPELSSFTVKMPSTSPANGRFDKSVWLKEIGAV